MRWKRGGSLPNIMNAANEIAVAAFLAGKIQFGGIAGLVESVMVAFDKRGDIAPAHDVADVLSLDNGIACTGDRITTSAGLGFRLVPLC